MKPSYIRIKLEILNAETDGAKLDLSVPIDFLYAGFKISYLTTEGIEDLIFDILKMHYNKYANQNHGSITLEELTLAIPDNEIHIETEDFNFHLMKDQN